MKKSLLLILSIIACLAFALVACNTEHEHKFADEWSKNETSHWHAATCGHEVENDKADHTFGEWVVTKAASCTEAGTREKVCSVCEYKVTEQIAASHKYEQKHDGSSHWEECSVCQDIKGEKADHTFGAWDVTKEANCTETGSKERVCTECEYKETEEIPVAHQYEQKHDYDYHWQECSECGHIDEKQLHSGSTCDSCDFEVTYSDNLEFRDIDETTCSVIGIGECGDETTLNIPRTHEGKTVVAIGGYSLHDGTFTEVNIPSTVTSIGNAAFRYCNGLTGVTIPEGVTEILGYAFADCRSLEEVVIPDSVTKIGGFVFDGSALYTNADNWVGNVLYVGKHLIKGDEENLSGELQINAGTLSIADYAFSGCKKLAKVNVPASVKGIGVGIFSECLALTEITVDDENEVFYDETNCLIEAESLKVVAGCPTSVIPANIKIIGESSFASLEITEIAIPKSVEEIETYAFGFCDKLEDYNYAGTIDEWKLITLGTGWKSDMAFWVIHCTDGFINMMGETRK